MTPVLVISTVLGFLLYKIKNKNKKGSDLWQMSIFDKSGITNLFFVGTLLFFIVYWYATRYK